jgi:GNAT superfamily N-acetyltransferase
MLVREASLADAPQIAQVHVDSWRITYSGIVSEDFLAAMSYEDFEAHWHGWLEVEECVVYVAESPSAQLVGFAFGGPQREEDYSAYDGELYAAYLLREHQRKGLGRQLLSVVANGLATQGKTSMLAWVLAENPSRHFYEVVGGKLLGREEIEIGGVMLEEVAYGWEDVRVLIPFAR